jgi:hypothetical protein
MVSEKQWLEEALFDVNEAARQLVGAMASIDPTTTEYSALMRALEWICMARSSVSIAMRME